MKYLLKLLLQNTKQFAAIGGQAVIEGVMMRSPHAFVVAVRKPNGKIVLLKDQWFSLNKKIAIFKWPFFRGILTLIETMMNGIVSLNYSANIAMEEEEKEKAQKAGKDWNELQKSRKNKEKIGMGTFISIAGSFIFGIFLFVFVPHAATAYLGKTLGSTWGLDSFEFHAIDGSIKGAIFLLYVYIIGFFPDIFRVFQYHGAEHKSISTFEAGEELQVENAKKYSTFHPRCGTTFVFFLLFISIVIFSGLFVIIPIGKDLPFLMRHIVAILVKIALTLPIAGISYELIKLMGKCSTTWWGKMISTPGQWLQRLTTREPDAAQLEVAMVSIRAVLFLEEKYNLRAADSKIVKREELEISSLNDIQTSNLALKDFLE